MAKDDELLPTVDPNPVQRQQMLRRERYPHGEE